MDWLGSPNNEMYRLWVLYCCHARAQKSHLLLDIVTSPNHLVSLTRESRQPWSPSYSLTCVGDQASSTIQQFSASGTTPIPILRAETITLPSIKHNSRPLLPKNITSRHTPKPKLSSLLKNCLCQSQPVESGRGAQLLKCTNINVRNQRLWKIS